MAKENIIPERKTISDMFSSDTAYRIPDYQRPYSWSEEELEDLWEDLYESYINKNENLDYYFLGSVVVVNDESGYEDVIDGQQRLTTLMIMLNVLAKNFKNINIEKESSPQIVKLKKITEKIYIDEEKDDSKLKLQSFYKYDTVFKKYIINKELDFSNPYEVTKKELKMDDPTYKYKNTANFFYGKFKELEEKTILGDFINYIFYNVFLIKVTCTNRNFAIKIFQVMNDRGTPLTNADIIKSYIRQRCDTDELVNLFNNNWSEMENIARKNELSVDDIIVFYEYFKLKENPKKQASEELEQIINNEKNISNLITEIHEFALSVDKVYESKYKEVYALRYLPWKFYIITMLSSAYKVDYPEKENLFKKIRKFYYTFFVAGETLNKIKQTSFNIIRCISEKQPIENIEREITAVLEKYPRVVQRCIENLNDEVFYDKYLKPLMLTIDYENKEDGCDFIELNKNIHMDHIIPRGYRKNQEGWGYINSEEANKLINTIGNMALLNWDKNISAQNYDFTTKLGIYEGKGKSQGITTFNTTRNIIDNYNKDINKKSFDIEHIKERKIYLFSLISKILEMEIPVQENIN